MKLKATLRKGTFGLLLTSIFTVFLLMYAEVAQFFDSQLFLLMFTVIVALVIVTIVWCVILVDRISRQISRAADQMENLEETFSRMNEQTEEVRETTESIEEKIDGKN